LASGYEDPNDHDELRHDLLLAALVGKRYPTGGDRVRLRDRGKTLASRNTLNRLELTPQGADQKSRYKKIVADRTSAATMRANQLRLWFSSVAYTLLQILRQFGLKGAGLARARLRHDSAEAVA
jgi:hypothetical protein